MLDRLASGAGTVVSLEGESGIGKTRLLQEVLGDACDRGWSVLSGRAEELERHRSLHALPGALPGARVPTAPDSDLVDMFVDGVASLATRGPVVLAVDDLNWCDETSLRALAAVARSTPTDPVLLLTAARPLPRNRGMDRLDDILLEVGSAVVHLGALGADDVAELTAHLTGAPTGPTLRDQVLKAGGNPFYVVETVRALLDELAIEMRDGAAECPDHVAPGSVRRLVLHRLTTLPSEAQQALGLASVLGSSFTVPELAAFSGWDAVALSEPLGAAVRAGFLIDDHLTHEATGGAGSLSFRHDLIRETLYTDLPASVRAGLHQRAGEALAAGGSPAARVAQQLALGAYVGEASAERAVRWLRRAAADAASSSSTAAALLERALLLTVRPSRTHDAVVIELLPPLLSIGRADEAAALATRLLTGSLQVEEAAAVRGWLAAAKQAQGDLAGALRELDHLDGIPPGIPGSAELLAFGAALRLYVGDAVGAERDASQAADAAAASGDGQTWCAVWATRALAAAARGDVPAGVTLASQAVERAVREPSLRFAVNDPRTSLGVLLANADRTADADAAFRSALTHRTASHAASPSVSFHWGLVGGHYLTGRLDDAQAEAQTGLALAADSGDSWGTAVGSALRARCLLYADDLPAAAAELDAADAHHQGPPAYAQDWLIWVRALLAEAGGRPEEAAALAAEAWRLLPGLRYLYGWRLMAGDVVRLTAVLDPATASSVVDEAHRGAELAGPGVPAGRGLALRCQGVLSGDVDLLHRAVTATRLGGRPLDIAATSEDVARALTSAGRPAEAVEALQEALTLYGSCGATRGQNRVRARLRALGVRHRMRTPPRRARAGWPALTPTEETVAELLAEGLTNRQIGERLFVSRRTVDTHLAHIFGKLGVRTRSAVAALAAQRQHVVQ